MDTMIRRKLETGERIHVHCVAHPYDNERYNATVSELRTALDQGQVLAARVLDGVAEFDAAVVHKKELAVQLRESLGHLARIAVSAQQDDPTLVEQFRVSKANRSAQGLLAEAQAVAGRAVSHRELFLAAGLPPGFLDELNALIAAFETAVKSRRAGRNVQVEARAALRVAATRVMTLVKKLDAMQRYRFRLSPAERRAWDSARNVEWPLKDPAAGGQADGGAGGQPGAGEGGAGTTR